MGVYEDREKYINSLVWQRRRDEPAKENDSMHPLWPDEAAVLLGSVTLIFALLRDAMIEAAANTIQAAYEDEKAPLHFPIRFAALMLSLRQFNQEAEDIARRLETEPLSNFDHMDRRVVVHGAEMARERHVIKERAKEISHLPRSNAKSPLRALMIDDMNSARRKSFSLKKWISQSPGRQNKFEMTDEGNGTYQIMGCTEDTERCPLLSVKETTLRDWWAAAGK